MIIMQDEMFSNVTIYGPQSEIDRFKALCIVAAPADDPFGSTRTIDFHRIIPVLAPPSGYQWVAESWNFRDQLETDQERDEYSFSFDSAAPFPILVFERLAELFPLLAFDCDCIADNDSSMGYGWFNAPPGGEKFCADYDVPDNYWEDDVSIKRDPIAELRYQALIVKISGRQAKP